MLRELEEIFPRWYDRDWTEAGALGRPLTRRRGAAAKSFEDTVRDYLQQELCNHDGRPARRVLARAEMLFERRWRR